MNISDIYSYQDCLRNADIRTYSCGYFPIAINRPREISRVSELRKDRLPFKASILRHIVSLKLQYAIQLLLMTIAMYKEKFSSSFSMKWIPLNESFNRLVYTKESTNTEIDCFYEMMETLCKSRVLKVSEGYCVSSSYGISLAPPIPDPTVNFVIDTDDVNKVSHFEDLFDTNRYKQKEVFYDWEEIKEYFVTLSLKDIELLHGDKVNRSTDKDKSLFKACENLDLTGIENAIREGANVLALNEEGESPLCTCVEALLYLSLDEDDWKTYIPAMKNCVDLLLRQGADINLYGFGACCSPLCESEYIEDASIMEFLLDRGANPNYNTDYIDMCLTGYQWCIKSTVLDMVYTDEDIYGEEHSKKQEELLEAHGAQLFIDSFNPDTGEMEKD